MSQRHRHLVIAACLSGSATLSACATPYLHDPAVETQAAAVKEAHGKIAGDTYFKDLRAAFAALQAEEEAVRTESLLADRDRQLTSAIRPTDLDSVPVAETVAVQSKADSVAAPSSLLRCIPESAKKRVPTRGPQVLCVQSLGRLHRLIGACLEPQPGVEISCRDRLDRSNLELWAELPDQIRSMQGEISSAEDDVARALKATLEQRDRWYARLEEEKAAREPATPATPARGRARRAARGTETAPPDGERPSRPEVKVACDDLLKYPEDGFEASPDFTAFPAGLKTALTRLRASCAALTKARAEMRPGGRLYSLVTPTESSLLIGLEKKAARAREGRLAAKGRAAEVEAAIKRLKKQVEQRGATNWQIEARVKELKEALAGAPAAATFVGSDGLTKLLENLLKAELQTAAAAAGTAQTAAEAEAPSATTTKINAVLKAVSALERVDNAIRLGDPNQRVSALLLAITAERQKADMAALEQEHLTEELKRLEAQEVALLTEASLLSETLAYGYGRGLLREPRGIVAMRGEDRDRAISALNRYSMSWSEGRVPYELLGQRETYLNREYRIRMAEKTAANWQALIQPAIAQLSAAGSGGIKPELIAALLGRLGIGTAILED